MDERTPTLPAAICQELTQRAAADVHWAEYLLLLNTCGEIWCNAPASTEACALLDIEERLGEELTRLARAIERILPGDFREFRSYLSKGADQRDSGTL